MRASDVFLKIENSSRASLAVRFTAKYVTNDHAEAGKIWENGFYTGKMDQQTQKTS